ncbi:MAG: hypothetical protein JOZ83_15825 [Silvibacterium sp.]|nr:hypothetical protein [Silvibacterium sp.]
MKRRTFLSLSAGAAAYNLAKPIAHAEAPTSGIMSPVLTRAYDNSRSGTTLNETILTQDNVSTKGIRKYFSLYMEGDARGAESQTLILPKVPVCDGTTRDVAVVSSMNNLVWCYDANNSDILWVTKLGVPVKGSSAIDMHNINDHWGVLSTGVLDPDTRRWYGVAWTSPDEDPKKGTHHIHVLNLRDGTHAHEPLALTSEEYAPGHGLPVQKYGSTMRKQRSGLLMTEVNGTKTIFFASGSVLETTNGAAGWIFAYDVASHRISAALAMSGGYGAGIWMAGSGLCADKEGYVYGMTGNGSFDAVSDWGETVFKVKYTPPEGEKRGSLAVVDWWTPYTDAGRIGEDPTQSAPSAFRAGRLTPKVSGVSAPSAAHTGMPVNSGMDRNLVNAPTVGKVTSTKPNEKEVSEGFADEDLGSAGLSLIPEYGIALACGKDGIAYEVNIHNMGKTKPADFANTASNYAKLLQPPVWYTYTPDPNIDNTPQDSSTLDFIYDNKTRHMHSTSVQYKSPAHGLMLFCWGENSRLRAWSMTPKGVLKLLAESAETASAKSAKPGGGMSGGFMSLSANAEKPGTALLWAIIPYGDANSEITPGRLVCYDPENFVPGPYGGGSQIKVLWDCEPWNLTFSDPKFNVPVVSGGKIFVPTYDGRVDVYGLAGS